MFKLAKKLLAIIKSRVIGLWLVLLLGAMNFVSAADGESYCSINSPPVGEQSSGGESEEEPEEEDPEC